MKTVISVVLAALFLVGCGNSSSETQNVEPAVETAKVVTEAVEAAAPQNVETPAEPESNETAPVEAESTADAKE